MEIEKSYFIQKSKIRNKIKEALKEIQDYEENIEILKSLHHGSPEHRIINKYMIIFFREYIDDIKQRVKMETNIYFY